MFHEDKSVKDLTGRDVFIGDKIVTGFKRTTVKVTIHEVIGFPKDKGIYIKSDWTNSGVSKISREFVKVESKKC